MKVTTLPNIVSPTSFANPATNDGARDPLQFDFGVAAQAAQCPPANDTHPRPSIFDPAAYDFGHSLWQPWQQKWAEAFQTTRTHAHPLYPLTGVFSMDQLLHLYKALRWIKSLNPAFTLEALRPEQNRSQAVVDRLNALPASQRQTFERVYTHLQQVQGRFTDQHIVPYLAHHEIEKGLFSLPPPFSKPRGSTDTAFLAFQNLVMAMHGRAVPEACIPQDNHSFHFYLHALHALSCPGIPQLRLHFSFHEGTGIAQLGNTWKRTNPKINHARRYFIAILQEPSNTRWRYVFVSHTDTRYDAPKPYNIIHLFDPTQPTQPHITMPLTKFAEQWGRAFLQCYMVSVQKSD
ncbi:MAG: hypothetical protein IPJ69_03890 [Deltaproteobacteria bacterium]|nr:MAG: hypothetical protein IPJ69_03890 [Deltaproteobacteria bacterium]